MKRIKVFFVMILVLLPSYISINIPSVGATNGQAKVYIVCLSNVGGWIYGDQNQTDPSVTKEGVIEALNFMDVQCNIPKAHPKFGNTPPFYDTSYTVVSDWNTYKSIIESGEKIIIVNTHGEILPIPSGYNPVDWMDRIADAMLNRRVSWVHTGGYPFYRVWYQGGVESEIWPSNGEYGFKNFSSHV